VLPAGHLIPRLAPPDPSLVEQMAHHLARMRLPTYSPLAFSNRASKVAQVDLSVGLACFLGLKK